MNHPQTVIEICNIRHCDKLKRKAILARKEMMEPLVQANGNITRYPPLAGTP